MQTAEAIVVKVRTVVELVKELILDVLDLVVDDGSLQVYDVRPSGQEEVVDVGIPAQDFQRHGSLGQNRGALNPSIVDAIERSPSVCSNGVVGEAVPKDGGKRQLLQNTAILDQAVNYSGLKSSG